jgi:fructose-bisphosphate aldolase, class II
VHLDHVQDVALARAVVADARRLGISSVMVDAAHLDYGENVATTADLARAGHDAGLWVEAELGAIGGKDGAHAPGVRTDPDEAASFVGQTGVDGLAVAVGSSHAMTTATAELDLDLITALAARLPVPLVLHGSSGVPVPTLQAAVAAGIRKINVGTALNVGYTAEVRQYLADNGSVTDPRKYLVPARDAVRDVVAQLCTDVLKG